MRDEFKYAGYNIYFPANARIDVHVHVLSESHECHPALLDDYNRWKLVVCYRKTRKIMLRGTEVCQKLPFSDAWLFEDISVFVTCKTLECLKISLNKTEWKTVRFK